MVMAKTKETDPQPPVLFFRSAPSQCQNPIEPSSIFHFIPEQGYVGDEGKIEVDGARR
jgi:hypothetical protein